MSRKTTIKGEVIRTTPSAVLFRLSEDNEVWIPRSVCEDGETIEIGDTDLIVADWFLDKEAIG